MTIRAARGERTQRDVEEEIGFDRSTLARIERGAHEPSINTAIALARWLGWSVEQVIEAARTPVQVEDPAAT